MAEASTQLKEILVGGNLLILPMLPGPPPAKDAPQEELQAWERSTLQLSCLAPLAGLPQVCRGYIVLQWPEQPSWLKFPLTTLLT